MTRTRITGDARLMTMPTIPKPGRTIIADKRPSSRRVDWVKTIALTVCAGVPMCALGMLIYVAMP